MMNAFNGNYTSLLNYTVYGTVDDHDFKICGPYKNDIYSNGSWFGDDSSNRVFPTIMLQIILMCSVSQLMCFVLRPLKQPKFICNLLAGIILGPSVLRRDKGFLDRIFQPREMLFTNSMSIIGAMYFVFLTSVKMDKSRIITTARKSMSLGLTCFTVPFIILMFLFYFFRNFFPGMHDQRFHVYLSISSSLSNFPVISNAIGELKLLTSELGRIAMSCAILHEILGWFIMSLWVILNRENPHQMFYSMVSIIVIVLFIILVLRPVVQWIKRRTLEGKPVDGFFINAILVGPLIMGVFSDMTGATSFPGALMMGLVIPAGPPLGSSLVDKCELIMSEFFLPFLYIRVGQLTDVYSITDWKAFTAFQFIMFAGYLAKMAGPLLSFLCFNGGGVRNAFVLGLFLNTKGVIELNFLLHWRQGKLIDESSYAALVICYIAVTAIVTPLVQIFYKPEARFQVSSSMKSSTRTLQATPFTGEFRILCGIHSEQNVHGIISLLKACNSTEITPMFVYAVHLIDLVGRAAPLLHPYDSQRKRFKENPTDQIMRALKKSLIEGSTSPVTIQPFRVIAPYNTMHESICRLVQDKYIPLVLVPFPENLDTHGRKTALHSFNVHLQSYAPCTVGILVDRSLPRIFSSTHFTYNVGVLFLGGPDDREALALVLRMPGHPGVSITVLRIHLREESVENKSEKYLDDCLMSEFKSRNIDNAAVVCRELAVENTVQVLDSIRSFENNYDLVIVGKQRDPDSQLERELLPWVENKELGTVGDMLASADFCGGKVSVLVMQCVVGGNKANVIMGSFSMAISDDISPSSSSSSSPSFDTDHDDEKVMLDYGNRDVTIYAQV